MLLLRMGVQGQGFGVQGLGCKLRFRVSGRHYTPRNWWLGVHDRLVEGFQSGP